MAWSDGLHGQQLHVWHEFVAVCQYCSFRRSPGTKSSQLGQVSSAVTEFSPPASVKVFLNLEEKKRKTVTISSHGNTKKIHSHNSGKLGNVASFITLPPTPPLGRSPGAGDPEHRARGPTVCACPPVWKRDSSVHGLGRGALWSAGQEWGPLLLEGDQGLSQVPIVRLLPARDKFGVGGRSGAELDLDKETDRRVRSRSGFRRRSAV